MMSFQILLETPPPITTEAATMIRPCLSIPQLAGQLAPPRQEFREPTIITTTTTD